MWFKSRFTISSVTAISFCLVGPTVPAAADILHVPGDFPTIQAAIDAAMDGDEVEVHPGTYNETINFLGKAIRVYSTDGPDVTIIDAQQTGTVVTCDSAEGPDSVLEGFTITGGNANFGGGMRNINSSPTVTGCMFIGNTAGAGGALFIQNSSPAIIGCTFRDNCAQVSDGGAMYNLYGNPALINCLMNGNCAAAFGGGIFSDLAALSLVNCTLSDNTASRGGGITNYAGVEMTLSSCIIWGNHAAQGRGREVQILSTSSVEVVNYSCVQDLEGAYGGDGNIDADPGFVDPQQANYRLEPGSPCIDAADNTAVPIDVTTDLDGNPRFVDDPDTKDTGVGDPPIVDMGAYEFQPVLCAWDLDGSGDVGVKDLLFLLGAWGPCPPKGECPADFDTSGDVGVKDLLILLGNWGPCR